MKIPIPTRPPENMTAAIVAKCHAGNQKTLINKYIARLQKRLKAWDKRYRQCCESLSKFIEEI